jgi:hypothetical protein
MSVPETPVNEDDSTVFCQNNIRFPRQTLIVYTITETMSPQIAAYSHFRLGILAFNTTHIPTAFLLIYPVHSIIVSLKSEISSSFHFIRKATVNILHFIYSIPGTDVKSYENKVFHASFEL